MEIVKEGTAKAVIVTAVNPTHISDFAAKELQLYLKKITGATIEIVKEGHEAKELPGDLNRIYVGKSEILRSLGLEFENLKSNEVRIKTGKGWVALYGKDYDGPDKVGWLHPGKGIHSYSDELKMSKFGEKGTLYSVYRFLENYCGVRWFMPGELGEVVPGKKTLIIGEIDYRKFPDFEHRFFSAFTANDDRDAMLWYFRVGYGSVDVVEINHTMWNFKDRFKNTHPEYFALYDGQRNYSYVCLSEPGVFTQVVEDCENYIRECPHSNIIPVMPNDGFVKPCECPLCKPFDTPERGFGGRVSDYVWGFVNRVAEEIAKTHPDKLIGCCAYGGYLLPPEKIKKLNKNVVVMLCRWPVYSWLPDSSRFSMAINNETLKGWQEKCRNIYNWIYYDMRAWTPSQEYVPNDCPHNLASDFKFLKGKSRGFNIEAETGHPDYPPWRWIHLGMSHLNAYVTAKCLWDADLNVDELLADYYEKFYGPAKDIMAGFFGRIEDIWMQENLEEPLNVEGENSLEKKVWEVLYPPEVMEELLSYLQEAKELTRDTIYGKRIDLLLFEYQQAYKESLNH
ncbi:MAG: DUF4838 domain-containing protein [Candidatus Omnitrophota bacterium]